MGNDAKEMPRRRFLWASVILTTMVVFLAAGYGYRNRVREKPEALLLRLGYVSGPHAAAIYASEENAIRNGHIPTFIAESFTSSGDIGYALIAGGIDAGFMETTKAAALLRSVSGLLAVGAVTFPYGATLVLRKDLDLRIDDLAGRTVAVAGRRCRLLHQFLTDAERLGADPAAITFVPLPFDQMLPALEAGKVDAILTQGGHALLAVAHRHSVLYQNWEVTGDDECCPKTLAQVEQVLVTCSKGVGKRRVSALLSELEAGSSVSSEVIRATVSARTRIPRAVLESFPVATFMALSPEQQAELGGVVVLEDDEDEHDCGQGCSEHGH